MGGYTTFSTFEYESVRLLQEGELLLGAIYGRERSDRGFRGSRKNHRGQLDLMYGARRRELTAETATREAIRRDLERDGEQLMAAAGEIDRESIEALEPALRGRP